MMRVLMLLLAALGGSIARAADLPPQVFAAYHDSWSEPPTVSPAATSIARLPTSIDVVMLAFARPDLIYRNDLDLAGTGLEYRIDGATLRDAIALLRRRKPEIRVLLSVGGAVYRSWGRLNVEGLVGLVRDLGLDGIDWDYELGNPDCHMGVGGKIACATDQNWQRLVMQGRRAFPRPALMTVSVWSVGAYGEGEFRQSRPRSRYTGSMLGVLRAAWATEIDLVSINAYDAGPDFSPMEAFRAYRAVWPGRLALGVEVRYAGGAGPFHTLTQAETLTRAVMRDPFGGMMLYALLMRPPPDGGISPDGPALAEAVCRGMARAGCEALPSVSSPNGRPALAPSGQNRSSAP